MYNRYIRNDHGTYTRVQEEDGPVTDFREARAGGDETPPGSSPEDSQNQAVESHVSGKNHSGNDTPESFQSHAVNGSGNRAVNGSDNQTVNGSGNRAAGSTLGDTAHSSGNGSGDSLRRILGQLRLGNVDTGDLILLMLLFLLFQENADEEVLAALGLLLIL